VDSDAARERAANAVAGLRDHLADLAAMQKKRAELEVSSQAADGTVEVTVNAQGQVVKTVVEKSYLDEHDFEELGGHITEAAKAAAGDAGQRVAELAAPIAERRKSRNMLSFSELVEGLPDLDDLTLPGLDIFAADSLRSEGSSNSSAGGIYDDGDGGVEFPTVRR
jgi:DNA-binding protein YbaB